MHEKEIIIKKVQIDKIQDDNDEFYHVINKESYGFGGYPHFNVPCAKNFMH